MNSQSINNSEVRAEQAASKPYQTIKLGLDVHADSIVVVRVLEHSAPQPAQRFTPAKFRQWVRTQLPLGWMACRSASARMARISGVSSRRVQLN